MAFCAPTAEEEPLVVDFGAMHDLSLKSPHREEISRLAPGTVFRSIGLGAICQAWGGFLAGVPFDEARAIRQFTGANQGSLVVMFRIDLFAEPDAFKAEMDAYVRRVHDLAPLAGFSGSHLPGGVEAERERAHRAEGVPVGRQHQKQLETIASELGISPPWA